MLEKQFYRNLLENTYDFSTVSGYAEGKFADFAKAAVTAAADAHTFSRNPAFEADDYFQELMLKALEKGAYFDAVVNLRAAVYSTARNIAIDLWKKSRDWKGAPAALARVPMESIEEFTVPINMFIEDEKLENELLAGTLFAELTNAFRDQMRIETLRSNPNKPLTIEETAKATGISTKTVTNYRRTLRMYAWKYHTAARRQLFGPHRTSTNKKTFAIDDPAEPLRSPENKHIQVRGRKLS